MTTDSVQDNNSRLWLDFYIALAASGSVLALWRPPPELTLAFGKARSATFDMQIDLITGVPSNLIVGIERTVTDSESLTMGVPWQLMSTASPLANLGRNRIYVQYGPNGILGNLAPRGFGRLYIANSDAAAAILRARVFATIT